MPSLYKSTTVFSSDTVFYPSRDPSNTYTHKFAIIATKWITQRDVLCGDRIERSCTPNHFCLHVGKYGLLIFVLLLENFLKLHPRIEELNVLKKSTLDNKNDNGWHILCTVRSSPSAIRGFSISVHARWTIPILHFQLDRNSCGPWSNHWQCSSRTPTTINTLMLP